MKILIVKLSSLGDVLHNLPVVWDIRARYPEAQVDWVIEEGLADDPYPQQQYRMPAAQIASGLTTQREIEKRK